MTDEELAALFAAADDLTRAAVQREADRRDREDRLSETRAKGAAVYAEGEQAAYAQYQASAEFCNGRLLSKAGMAAHDRGEFADEFALWRMPADKAELYASEELHDYWLFVAPRITPRGVRPAAGSGTARRVPAGTRREEARYGLAGQRREHFDAKLLPARQDTRGGMFVAVDVLPARAPNRAGQTAAGSRTCSARPASRAHGTHLRRGT